MAERNKYSEMMDEMLTDKGIDRNIDYAKNFALSGSTGMFPIGRYNQLLKQSPKMASTFQNWYKGLANNKWGTKIFPGVSNLNVPVNVAKAGVPAVRSGFGNAANILSNKAKLQLAGMGVAGTAGMGIGAYNNSQNNEVAVGTEPVYEDKLFTPALAIGAQKQAYLDGLNKQVNKPATPADLFKNVKTVDPKIREQAINNIKEAEMKKAIAAVNKPNKNVFLPKDTYITSDPGYKDGYRVDNVAASNPLSVYNIMDADNGSQGAGYEW